MFVEGVVAVENSNDVVEVLLFDLDNYTIVDKTFVEDGMYKFIITKQGRFSVLLKMKNNTIKTAYYSEVLNGKDSTSK